MNKLTCLLLGAAALASTPPASADDSSAALGAGGIVLTQSADIRMAAEDLRISPKEVRIRFEFANDSGKDIDTIVAFPLPDIDTYKFWGSPIGTTTSDPLNFVGFEVSQDGKKLPVSVEQRAIYNGRDVTDIVKSAHVPVNTIVDGSKTIDKLSKSNMAILVRAGLVERDGDNTITRWTARTRFYWTQHFPAGRAVTLEQHYQPVTGQSFFSDSELSGGEDARYYQSNFCFDASSKASIAAKIAPSRKANPQNGGLLNAFTTDYVLVTGNNWKGPIGRFHLTVDKLKPDNILSMCWDGDLKKTGATTFESTRENFAPPRDIKLLVLTGSPPPG
ncbi:MAG: DUF4424 family protein [Rhizomicrobium sp.]|jgi:hypothetical protein